MTISHIKTFRINDDCITQSINCENDTVIFTDDSKGKIIFTMDSDCRTHYYDKDDKKVFIGKFSYTDEYYVKFNFDVEFLKSQPDITFKEIVYDSNDFIKSEELLVYSFLYDYNEDQKLNRIKQSYFNENMNYFRDDFKSKMSSSTNS